MRPRPVLVCGLLLFIIGSSFFVAGQERRREEKDNAQAADSKSLAASDQIEVKVDRFSNTTTLILKPQILIDKPDHFMTLGIKTEIGKSDDPQRKVSLYSFVHVDSQSKVPLDYGDDELRFLVGDKPLDIKTENFSEYPSVEAKYYIEKNNLTRKRSYMAFLFEPSFESFSKAENIEMRLGPFEMKLGQQVTASLREYAKRVLEQHNKISKEGKP
jgi:hypothetical protein